MERDYAIGVLEREARLVLDLAAEDEDRLALAVPCCPGWTLNDLVKHLGNAYNWADFIVDGRLAEPPAGDAIPRRPKEMAASEWMATRRDRLVSTLREVPDDAVVWTFSSASPTATFWWRRQAHETLIHRVDAQTACEMPITSVEPALAADNVSELFEMFSFASTADSAAEPEPSGPGPSGDSSGGVAGEPAFSIHLHATDVDEAEWTIDTRNRSISRQHSKADVALRGPAWALARWCWGRPALGELQAFGDVDAAEAWRRTVVP